MDPVKLRFYTEMYAKENHNTKLVENFHATAKIKSITAKFYARHEAITSTDAPPEYVDLISKSQIYVPKEIYRYRPPAVNMDYGWFAKPLIQRSKDPRLSFPVKQCDFVKNELLIRHLNKGVPEEKFKGIPLSCNGLIDEMRTLRKEFAEWRSAFNSRALRETLFLFRFIQIDSSVKAAVKEMAGRGFCVRIELDLHAVTCPGVWLCPNGKVALQLNTFNNCIESRQITPIFPLLFHDKFQFKKVFTGVTTLSDLQHSLEEEFLYIELVQWSKPDSRGVILATFETNLVDLLYPSPCFKGLLAGVDVDLLMEPTKYFPGILAPKIEISTRTVIEEVIGICDSTVTRAHVVNPKTINSKNPPCFCRKPPSKGIIRQRKVCHSQGRHRSQINRKNTRRKSSSRLVSPCSCPSCRNCCSQTPSSLEVERVYLPSASNRRSLSQSGRCYHGVSNAPKCSCPSSSPRKSSENTTVHNDSHVFDSCPVCSKYKCYFSCHCEGKDGEYTCACKGNPPKVHGAPSSAKHIKYSSAQKEHSSCTCRPSSAPSPREDPSTLLLKAKIKQLQKAKARLSYICNNREDDTSEYDQCCGHKQDRPNGRQGFYKNLEKFYKRMYKQAKLRAEEVDCV